MSTKTRANDGKRWFTVVGNYHDTGLLYTASIRAHDEQAAFAEAIEELSEEEVSFLTLVAAVPGAHHAYAPQDREGKVIEASAFLIGHGADPDTEAHEELLNEATDREFANSYGDCER